jgi:hypothetical protein
MMMLIYGHEFFAEFKKAIANENKDGGHHLRSSRRGL